MRKSIYNIFFGIFGQAVTIIIGLLLPRLRIVSFGSEVNGMLSSVQQVFTYFALLEAGVGSATLQALYGPVALNDKKSINSILAATHRYYQKTGIVYTILVILFAICYPLAVKSDIPVPTMIAVILFNGMGSVLAYFFQGKYRILLQAEGKQYIITNLATFVSVFSGFAKIVLIYAGFGVVALQAVYFGFNLVQVAYFAWYIKKKYKWIDLSVNADFQAISQKGSVLVHQISQMVFNNTDVLILTIFCDLKVVSVYSLYNMIFDMVSTLISNINNGFSFRLGQLFNSDRERFNSEYRVYERYYTAFSFGCYCIAYLFIFPFISLYTKGISDANYQLTFLPVMFTAIKLMVSGRAPSGFVASYAGHFKKTQMRAILEAVINISVSIIGVNLWGIYGVLAGTIAALIYRANDMIIYANRVVMERSPWETYKWWLVNFTIFIAVAVLAKPIVMSITSYLSFFRIICFFGIIILSIFLAVTYFLSRKITYPYLQYMKNTIMKKLTRRR